MIDLNGHKQMHTVVDKRKHYLGHPSTVKLLDGKSLLVAYPDGHGRGRLIMRKTSNGGKAWADTVTPKPTYVDETPVFYRVQLPNGKSRILLITCARKARRLRYAYSDNEGASWTDFHEHQLNTGLLVVFASMYRVKDLKSGKFTHEYRGIYHDNRYTNYQVSLTFAKDPKSPGGYRMQWSAAKPFNYQSAQGMKTSHHAGLCEAFVLRSPNGKRLAALYRPQLKRTNAMISFSDDEGSTWTDPRELPGSLSGERHVAHYTPDGRLLICFRDYSLLNPGNPSHADWVAWVGTFRDLETGKEGEYRIRLKDNYGNSTNNRVGDCGYTAIDLLPNGVFSCITYGHFELAKGQKHPDGRGRPPFILQTRFTMKQLDAIVKSGKHRLGKPGAEH